MKKNEQEGSKQKGGLWDQGPTPWHFLDSENLKGLNPETITETVNLLQLVLSHYSFGKIAILNQNLPQFSQKHSHLLQKVTQLEEKLLTQAFPLAECHAVVCLRIGALKRFRQKAKLCLVLVKEASGWRQGVVWRGGHHSTEGTCLPFVLTSASLALLFPTTHHFNWTLVWGFDVLFVCFWCFNNKT